MAVKKVGNPQERRDRSQALRNGLLFALAAALLWFAFATVSSAYGGTGRSSSASSRERNVTAVVQSCHRQGPISLNGFGYWWTCRAAVGAATVELRHSVATQQDVGRSVPVHELCANTNYTDCKYGRIDTVGWGGVIQALHLIEVFLLPLLLLGAALGLIRYFVWTPNQGSLY